MIESDRQLFSQSMARLFAIYADELTNAIQHAWWGALEEYSIEDVMRAMTLHAKDPNRGRFRPTPADIIHHLTETIPGEKRIQRAHLAEERHALSDPIHRAMYLADNDLKLGLLTPEKHAEVMQAHRSKLFQIESDPRFRTLLALAKD